MCVSRFSIIPAKALSDRRLSRTDISVLNALGTYGDRNGWCWPSLNTVAQTIGAHRRTVNHSITKLLELRYLARRSRYREDGGQTSNEYKILYDVEEEAPPLAKTPPPLGENTIPPLAELRHTPLGVATPYPYEGLKGTTQEKTPPPSEREKKISLEELSVEHLAYWIEQRKVTAKTPLEVNIELCLEQMKAHYLAIGGTDGAGRMVVDWVEKAKRWILEEQKKLGALRSRQSQKPETGGDLISHSFYSELKRQIREGQYVPADDRERIRQYDAAQRNKGGSSVTSIAKTVAPPQKCEPPPPKISPQDREKMSEKLKELTEQLRAP